VKASLRLTHLEKGCAGLPEQARIHSRNLDAFLLTVCSPKRRTQTPRHKTNAYVQQNAYSLQKACEELRFLGSSDRRRPRQAVELAEPVVYSDQILDVLLCWSPPRGVYRDCLKPIWNSTRPQSVGLLVLRSVVLFKDTMTHLAGGTLASVHSSQVMQAARFAATSPLVSFSYDDARSTPSSVPEQAIHTPLICVTEPAMRRGVLILTSTNSFGQCRAKLLNDEVMAKSLCLDCLLNHTKPNCQLTESSVILSKKDRLTVRKQVLSKRIVLGAVIPSWREVGQKYFGC